MSRTAASQAKYATGSGTNCSTARMPTKAEPVTGRPISPASTSARPAWWPPPKKVSGALPMRRPCASASCARARASASERVKGFSV